MEPSSGCRSCSRYHPHWAGAGARLRLGTGTHRAARASPSQAGSRAQQRLLQRGRTLQQSDGRGRISQRGWRRPTIKTCNLLVYHRACFSLKIPTQQLLITSFLPLITWLAWQHIPTLTFYPCASFQLPRMASVPDPSPPFQAIAVHTLLLLTDFSLNSSWHPQPSHPPPSTAELGTELQFSNTRSA